jgi:lysophospholipase L1-like esterase
MRRIRRVWLALLMLAALVVAAELAGRIAGLRQPVLYQPTVYGYRALPDQHLRRLGKSIDYNTFGLRSAPIAPLPAAGVVRVLCLGDSITNGGTLTDQSQTWPEQLQQRLRTRLPAAEVLNASAGGWALENEQGWLAANGTFGSQVVVLEVGTHDLFQPMSPSSLVDLHPAFPSHAPALALQEIVFRYALPAFGLVRVADPGTQSTQPDLATARRSVERVIAMAGIVQRAGAMPIVLHVEQPAALEPQDELTHKAKDLLGQRLREHNVDLIRAGPAMSREGGLFRDAFHPNERGNRVLAELVDLRLQDVLSRR